MSKGDNSPGTEPIKAHQPAIQFLAEAALRTLATKGGGGGPRTHQEWVDTLCASVMAEGDVKHQLAVSQLMASGMSAGDMLHDIVPAVARQLGDKWLLDEVSFVDVAVGSARLQSLFHGRDDLPGSVWAGSSAPSGEAVLMVVPEFEQHTLGAFVAADEMRHAGLWVRIGLLLTAEETCELLQANHFSMLGISIGSRDSVDRTADFVNYIRTYSEKVPPVVVSGNVVERLDIVRSKTGADFVVSTVQEAIESCGLEVTGEQALLEADAE